MDKTKTGPREYKPLPIANTVVVKPVKYLSKPDGWVMEPADFTELSYFLGYKFEPRSQYAIWSPEGIARGGHLESRSKLVTVLQGNLYYVLVDMRPGEDLGKKYEFYLGDSPNSLGQSVLVPEGVIDCWFPIDGSALTHSVGDRPYSKFDNEMTLDIFDPDLGLRLPMGAKHHAREGEEKSLTSFNEFIQKIND